MSMVKGIAPNLKNVSLVHGVHQSAPGVFSTIPRPPWKGFQVPSGMLQGDRPSMGRLENLVLKRSMTGDQLLQWSCCTDFSHLRSLTAGSSVCVSAVRALTEISRQTPMRALLSLNLKLHLYTTFDQENAMVDSAVAELLQSLCPLEVLELQGHVGEKSWEAVKTHHAETLRKLSFRCVDTSAEERFKFSPERATQLSRGCPRLETVDVREPSLWGPTDFEDLSDWI